MMSIVEPREGRWYADRTRRETFFVINVDEADGIIDLQDQEGDIDEMGFDEWYALDLEPLDAPGMTAVQDGEDDEWGQMDGGDTDRESPLEQLYMLRKTGQH